MMLFDENSFEALLEKILSITDLMYQSIKADQFEIFDSALDERYDYLIKYQELHDKLKMTKVSEIETFVMQMNKLDVLIQAEIKRYENDLQTEFIETKRQRNALMDGQKKTQKYLSEIHHRANESTFDRKK